MNHALPTMGFDRFLLLDLDGMSESTREEIRSAFASFGRAFADVVPRVDAAFRELRDLFPRSTPSLDDLLDDLPVELRGPWSGAITGKLPAPPELRADRSARSTPALHTKTPRSSWETARRAYCCSRGRVTRTVRARRQAGIVG